VSRFPEPKDDDWQPAVSAPGEMYTPEGRIRATGIMARNLKNDDPRLRSYQKSMLKTGAAVLGIGLLAMVIVAVIASLF
jgi:hypothetical protein